MFDNAECNVVGAETWMCGGKIKIARKLPQLSPYRRPQVNYGTAGLREATALGITESILLVVRPTVSSHGI